ARPRTWRCSTISCCLSAAFSASSQLLGLKSDAPRFKRKKISATIVADIKRFCHQIKTDEVFGTHTQRIDHFASDINRVSEKFRRFFGSASGLAATQGTNC